MQNTFFLNVNRHCSNLLLCHGAVIFLSFVVVAELSAVIVRICPVRNLFVCEAGCFLCEIVPLAQLSREKVAVPLLATR